MADQGHPPIPPEAGTSRIPTVPQQVGVVPAYVTAVPSVTSAVPRRSKAWIWWTLGVALLMLLIVGSCTIPFVLLAGKGFNSGATGGGGAVAVIHVDGVIAGSGSNVSGVVTPEYFYELLKRAEEDVRVKAIVLRVDSPGGTVAASEEIARYIKQCSKPVVVSVGDVGASGAYMIASQSDEIWAMPGSAVGSIGVISEIPNVGALLGKVGVNFQVITAGKYKDAGSLYRPLSKEERALIQGSVNEAYGQFIDIVAEGRSLPRSQVESMATGWAWNGEEAKKLGLIDRLGTYQDAMDAAAKRGGIKGKYETITYEDQFGDLLGSLLGISRQLGNLEALSGNRDAAVRSALPR